jgi:hypothetical protein
MQLTHQEDVHHEENEIPEQRQVEQPKPKVQDAFDLDGDNQNPEGAENPEQPKEENPEGEGEVPKFKPENYAWTYYDGKPRNYIQILYRLRKLPFEKMSVHSRDIKSTIFENIENHLKNWETEQTYGGIINLTTIV